MAKVSSKIRFACLVVVTLAAQVDGGSASARLAGLCPYCLGNAATVGDDIVFDELNVTPDVRRTIDDPAITKVSMVIRGQDLPATLAVARDVLTATAGGKTYSGADLVGLMMTVSMRDGRAYVLQLVEVDGKISEGSTATRAPTRFWVTPKDVVHDYTFLVKKIQRRDNPGTKPCTETPDDRCVDADFKEHLCKGKYRNEDALWSDYGSAITFEGDYFDPRKTDQPPTGTGWFNLACAGTAAAKMHLLRHTQAGTLRNRDPALSRDTTQDQRTAMLKTITADYCGDGHLPSWTADGTPLFWTDVRGWFPDSRADVLLQVGSGKLGVEAIWGPQGALCLNVPRRNPAPGAICPNPDKVPAVTRANVAEVCLGRDRSLPVCTKPMLQAWAVGQFGYVLSVNGPKAGDYCSE